MIYLSLLLLPIHNYIFTLKGKITVEFELLTKFSLRLVCHLRIHRIKN